MPSLPEAVFRRWVHSREEDGGGRAVYRPTGYRFPPARGRDGLEFHRDGAFTLYRIGAGDGSDPVPGRWTAQPGGAVLIHLDDPQAHPYALVILESAPDRLVVRPT